jgi:hypothetical protein
VKVAGLLNIKPNIKFKADLVLQESGVDDVLCRCCQSKIFIYKKTKMISHFTKRVHLEKFFAISKHAAVDFALELNRSYDKALLKARIAMVTAFWGAKQTGCSGRALGGFRDILSAIHDLLPILETKKVCANHHLLSFYYYPQPSTPT